MSSGLLVSVEGLIVLGIVLGVGIWQLVSVRRELRNDRERKALVSPPADAAGGADGHRSL